MKSLRFGAWGIGGCSSCQEDPFTHKLASTAVLMNVISSNIHLDPTYVRKNIRAIFENYAKTVSTELGTCADNLSTAQPNAIARVAFAPWLCGRRLNWR